MLDKTSLFARVNVSHSELGSRVRVAPANAAVVRLPGQHQVSIVSDGPTGASNWPLSEA